MAHPHVHISIYTSFLLHLLLLVLCSSRSIPTVSGFGTNTNNVCDVNTPISVHRSLSTGASTRVVLSSPSVGPGGSLTVTLSGTIRGFVLYAADAAGIHKGVLTNNANSAICGAIPTGSDTASTIRHTNSNTKLNQQFAWTAPTQTGVYTFYALVTESGGSAPVYRLPVVSVTVTQQPPPVVNPNPVPSAPTPGIPTNPPMPRATNNDDNDNDNDNDNDDNDNDNGNNTPAPTVTPATQTPNPPVTGTSATTSPPSTAPGGTATGRIIPSVGATRQFDVATVAVHATPKTDCWTSLNNVVYDITTLFNNHPGGDSTLISWCGKDCTSIFGSVHSTPAADLAKMEANYRIGVLGVFTDQPVTQAPPVVVNPDKGVVPLVQGGSTSTTQSGMNDGVSIGLIVGGIAVAAIVIGGIVYWQKFKKSTAVAPPITDGQYELDPYR